MLWKNFFNKKKAILVLQCLFKICRRPSSQVAREIFNQDSIILNLKTVFLFLPAEGLLDGAR